jgi:hypothetical protein
LAGDASDDRPRTASRSLALAGSDGLPDVSRRLVHAVLDGRSWRRIISVITVTAAVMAAGASAQTTSGITAATTPGITVPRAGIANASTPAAGMVLGGFTSQGWPAVLDIAKNGNRIRVIGVGLDMKCTTGDEFGLPDGFINLPIAGNGKVHATRTIPPSPGPTVSLTGGSDSLTGRLDRKRSVFVANWHLHLSLKSSSGQTDQCDSVVSRSRPDCRSARRGQP